jgi:catechol 2,3-dioxygenase-like lactoylglutathione lyase family enzyme
MSRVQLALSVSNLDAAIEFYSKLFGSAPAKRHPDYANFAIADPPLKLVLIEKSDERAGDITGALNHLGIEVETPEEVATTSARLSGDGLETSEETGATCCYAVQDKVWVEDPDGVPWEVYAILADAPVESGIKGDGTCCAVVDAAPCC